MCHLCQARGWVERRLMTSEGVAARGREWLLSWPRAWGCPWERTRVPCSSLQLSCRSSLRGEGALQDFSPALKQPLILVTAEFISPGLDLVCVALSLSS